MKKEKNKRTNKTAGWIESPDIRQNGDSLWHRYGKLLLCNFCIIE